MVEAALANQSVGESVDVRRRGRWLVLGLMLLLLAPFLGKAFHLDDPMYLWAADQIRSDPWQPYSVSVNWYGELHSMADVMQNPPAYPYFLAVVSTLLGKSEWAIHLAMLLPTGLCILAVYDLATQLGAEPRMAAVGMLVTPVFLVSASTVMCDVPMLALWCWACAFWVRGMQESRHRWLAAAAVCAGLSGVTKYFGVAIVPLLLAHGLVFRRSIGLWLFWLALPVVMYGVWSAWSRELYGVSHVLQAVLHSRSSGRTRLVLPQIAVACSFAGGGLLWPLILSWTLPGHRRAMLIAVGISALILTVVSMRGGVSWGIPPGWLQVVEWSLFVFGGTWVLVVAVEHLWRFRDASAVLVSFWIFGTFLFAAFCNWTVAGRTVLPLAPALALLVARDIRGRPPLPQWHMAWPMTVVAAFALIVTWADARWADSCRTAAREFARECRSANQPLWFVGHWGLQHYLQEEGALPLRFLTEGPSRDAGTATIVEDKAHPELLRLSRPQFGPDDRLLVPENNTNLPGRVDGLMLVEHREYSSGSFVAVMQSELGAGFYASVWGPLPYGFGQVPPETYRLFKVRPVEQSR